MRPAFVRIFLLAAGLASLAAACTCIAPDPNSADNRATTALRDEDFVIVADVTGTTTIGDAQTETQLANATVRESFKGNMTVGSDVHFRTVTACCLCGLQLSAGRWLLAGRFSNAAGGVPSLSSCSVSCVSTESACAATIAAVRSQSGGTCSANSDCRPARCCGASHCVPTSQAPDCSAVSCAAVCEAGTMDCGHGTCTCSNGACGVQWATAPATATIPAPPSSGRCTRDSDCAPASCCHSTTCTLAENQPHCFAPCTADCRAGTMDCGAGSCGCNLATGTCRVNWAATPQPPTNRRRDSLGAAAQVSVVTVVAFAMVTLFAATLML